MASLLEFTPLFQETAVTIRARLDADANAGLTVDDPRWIDTRQGTFYWDVTQVLVLEFARLWDALSVEVPAAAFAMFAWGPYLDSHAAMFGLVRKAAVAATGEVTFTGDPGTIIPPNIVVSAPAVSDDGEAIDFETTTGGTTSAGLSAPTGLVATPGTGGSLPAGDYFYRVTATNAFGETDGSVEIDTTVSDSGTVALDWTNVAGAVSYRVYRSTTSGELGQRIYDDTTSAFTDDGTVTPGVAGPPDLNTTAGVTLPIEAVVAGTSGNVSAGAIDSIESPLGTLNGVSNQAATQGGTEIESDGELRERVLFEFEGKGAGVPNDYKRWARSIAGVGRVYVEPVWAGAGTVLVVVMTADGDPVASTVVDAVQEYLDPAPGSADGQAPPGITVTVTTPTPVSIGIAAASVTFKDGYSMDGAAGTVAQRAVIEKALKDYIDALDVGEDVIYEHVKAQIFRAEGVYNVAGVTVESGTADIAITSGPPQIAQYGGFTA